LKKLNRFVCAQLGESQGEGEIAKATQERKENKPMKLGEQKVYPKIDGKGSSVVSGDPPREFHSGNN